MLKFLRNQTIFILLSTSNHAESKVNLSAAHACYALRVSYSTKLGLNIFFQFPEFYIDLLQLSREVKRQYKAINFFQKNTFERDDGLKLPLKENFPVVTFS